MLVNSLSNFLKRPTTKQDDLFLAPGKTLTASQMDGLSAHLAQLPESTLALFTSGTSGDEKAVIIFRTAFEAGAQSVNNEFKISSLDVWLCPLPVHHVGGLSIYERARLSSSRVVRLVVWSVADFLNLCKMESVSWTSLVPTQIFDLVREQKPAPETLKGVFVGGGSLSPELFSRARQLGWPLLVTFGMTEASSQIATVRPWDLSTPRELDLKLLPHVKAKVSADGRLCLKSKSLFFEYLRWHIDQWQPERALEDDWFITSDRAQLNGDIIKPLGRATQEVKIKGELVNIFNLTTDLNSKISKFEPPEWTLLALPHERSEWEVAFVSTSITPEIKESILSFNNEKRQHGEPAKRIRKLIEVSSIPKTDLGKIQWKELSQQIQNLSQNVIEIN